MKQTRFFSPDNYELYVKEYIEKSKIQGKPINQNSLRKEPFNLPDARWFIKYCPDKSVTSWAEFIDWCGFVAK